MFRGGTSNKTASIGQREALFTALTLLLVFPFIFYLSMSPFQKNGSETPYEVKETKTKCIMRFDMPGCPEKDLAYWVDSNNVHIFAEEPPDAELDHSGRKCGGSMIFNPEFYNVNETKAKLVNGVLWITVTKGAKTESA